MRTYVDRMVVAILGVALTHFSYEDNRFMISLLCAVILWGINSYLENVNDKRVESISYGVIALTCMVVPILLPFLPIVIYSVVYSNYENNATMLGIIAGVLGISVYCGSTKGLLYGGLMAGLSFIAMLFATRDCRISKLEKELLMMRDSTTELTNTLKERNKYLVETQENEIYIATLSERNRIAREIHDNVGHMLSRSILQLGAIMAISKGQPTDELLEGLKDTLNLAMNNIRESVHDLHKESFDVAAAAQQIVENLRCEVDLSCDISSEADKEVKYAFITILREAVTNISKHSNATKVKIVLAELQDYYQMLVEDNGTTSESNKTGDEGIGITNITERICALHGICNISRNNGFRIFISVPKEKVDESSNCR